MMKQINIDIDKLCDVIVFHLYNGNLTLNKNNSVFLMVD
jgi:hypothetical protein